MPYAARTFLSHPPVENASDKPEHCFRNAKIAKKFDLTANFSEFLNSFRFLDFTAFSSRKTDIPVIIFSCFVHIHLHIKKF